MEKVKFIKGVPQILALKYTRGKEVESEYNGTETRYTITDGRPFYALQNAAEQIDALHLGAGEQFSIVKLGEGEFDVQRAETALQTRPLNLPRVQSRQVENTSQGNTQQAQNNKNALPDRVRRYMEALHHARIALFLDQQKSKETQFSIEYGADDVRCLATTFFLNEIRESRP